MTNDVGVGEESHALPDESPTSIRLPESRDILEEYLQWRAENSSENKRHEVVPHVYHASEGGYCLRQLYYKHTGVPAEKDKPLGRFIMGELVEEVMFDAFRWKFGEQNVRKVPIGIEVEHRGRKFTVTGKTDVVIYHEDIPVDQREIKSNQRGKNATSAYHQLVQTSVYGKVLKILHNRVVHPSRNDPLDMPARDRLLTEQELERYFNEALDRFAALDIALETKTLPMAQPPVVSQCTWCDYPGRCKSDGGWNVGPRGGLKPPTPIYEVPDDGP